MAATPEWIAWMCEMNWQDHRNDSGGFVRGVAATLGFEVPRATNTLLDYVDSHWIALQNGTHAASSAAQGWLVVGGLKASPRGHVVVVVDGPIGKYPTAYWTHLHGGGRKKTSIVWAWKAGDRDKVHYYRSPHWPRTPLSGGLPEAVLGSRGLL